MVASGHHYLPQCYLKGLSKPRKQGKAHCINAFDRSGRTFRTKLANIAKERDFNRIEVEGYPSDAFERGVAQFESELAPALVRIRERRLLENKENTAYLFNLIGLAAIRNPRFRELTRDFQERVLTQVLDLSTATRGRWEDQTRRVKDAGYKPKHDIPYEEMQVCLIPLELGLCFGSSGEVAACQTVACSAATFLMVLSAKFKNLGSPSAR